jgi:alkanesulfonate monooxygenase SsuD/methylene tetrahydromethanopterin reductase-like flavin-dependent oxidoreductase (luciferase family)
MSNGTVLDRVGVYLFPWGKEPPTVQSIAALAADAEALGFDSVHVPWHFTLPDNWIFPEFGNRFLLDPLVALPAIVAATSRIRVSLNTAILPVLHPFLWAQYLATLDAMSGGRTIAGAAIGWWPDDFSIGGASLKERGARMDEALDVVTRLWAGDPITEAGRFWDCRGLALDPRPTSQPLPIWVGGGLGSVARTARLASALMPLDLDPDEVRTVYRPALDAAAERHGRPLELAVMSYAAIADSDEIAPATAEKLRVLMSFQRDDREGEESLLVGSPERCAARLRALFEAGVDYLVLDCQFHGWESEGYARDQLRRFAEQVAPLV